MGDCLSGLTSRKDSALRVVVVVRCDHLHRPHWVGGLIAMFGAALLSAC